MKNALVVYESMFGHTRDVAAAIADGLSQAANANITLVEVSQAPTVVADDVDLLVVGAPTHAFGLSTPDTRGEAKDKRSQPLVSAGIGVREWLAALPTSTSRTRMATFDTHVRQRWVPGHAAPKIAHALTRMGLSADGKPASFYVDATMGPLLPGELRRAREWGQRLSRQLLDAGTSARDR
jgi:hypothetical protein